ncbi:MAG: hypothetical protein Q9181_006581 [Wetmoreana brouardii]
MLDMDPKAPRLPGGFFKDLKSWQVQALAWAIDVERALPGFLLADDIGLGKTITALSHLVRNAKARGASIGDADASEYQGSKPKESTGILKKSKSSADNNRPASDGKGEANTGADLESSPDNIGRGSDNIGNPNAGTDPKSSADNISHSSDNIGDPNTGTDPKSSADNNKPSSEGYSKRNINKDSPPGTQSSIKDANKGTSGAVNRGNVLAPTAVEEVRTPRTKITSKAQRAQEKRDKAAELVERIKSRTYKPALILIPSQAAPVLRAMDFSAVPKKSQAEHPPVGEEDDIIGEDEEEARTVEELRALQPLCPSIFSRVLCDEAQKLKSRSTFTHHSVATLDTEFLGLLTATPILNRPQDLAAFLALIFNPAWSRFKTPQLEDYSMAADTLQQRLLSADDIRANRWLLDPSAFEHHTKSAGQLDPAVANVLIPPILSLFHLRRTTATVIPGVNGRDVRMAKDELEKYTLIHTNYTYRLAAGYNEDNEQGRRNIFQHRRLVHAVLHPLLEVCLNKTARTKQAAHDINTWAEKDKDHGATFFFESTRHSKRYPPPRERFSIAEYLGFESVKLRFLAKLAYDTDVRDLGCKDELIHESIFREEHGLPKAYYLLRGRKATTKETPKKNVPLTADNFRLQLTGVPDRTRAVIKSSATADAQNPEQAADGRSSSGVDQPRKTKSSAMARLRARPVPKAFEEFYNKYTTTPRTLNESVPLNADAIDTTDVEPVVETGGETVTAPTITEPPNTAAIDTTQVEPVGEVGGETVTARTVAEPSNTDAIETKEAELAVGTARKGGRARKRGKKKA